MLYSGFETLTHTHTNARGTGSNKTNKESQINKYYMWRESKRPVEFNSNSVSGYD